MTPPALVAVLTRPALSTMRRKTTTVRQVAPGVELIQEITPVGEPEGPLVVTVLRVDLGVKGTHLEAALGGDTVWANDPTLGREIPSKTVARRKAIAGVNASFFPFAGNPIGLHIEKGELVTEPSLPRTAFLILEDGSPRFGRFGFEGLVNDHPLHGLNRKPGKGNELLLFTPIFADKTLKTPERVEVVLEGIPSPLKPAKSLTGKVVSVGRGGETPLKPGTVVLSAGAESAQWLTQCAKVGETLTLCVNLRPLDATTMSDPATILHAVTGAPRIVANGKLSLNLKAESVAESFSTTRHPRTAIGVTAEGKLLLVTVDGRQPKLSRGASLPELAAILLAQGAVDAVNLDGGGSSACSVRGALVNSPSEGVERPVADSLLIFSEESMLSPGGPELTLSGPPKPLKIGETYEFARPVGMEPGTSVWSTKGGIGFINQDGVFRAQRPGKGSVQLWRGSEFVWVPVRVEVLGEKEKRR